MGRRADGRWSSTVCGLAVSRQNGKNAVLELRELYGMVILGEKFLHTAHEVKTARKAFLRLASFFENEREYPELAAMVKEIRRTNGQEAIVLTNGGSIEFIARSKGSGRGFTVDVLVLDEAQDLTEEQLAALLPTISAAPLGNPQRILTGTPPAPNMDGSVFLRQRRLARLQSQGRGKSPRLCWHDWGLEGPLPDVDDRALWYAANPALGGRLHIDTIVDERGMMDEETFARERLCWWGDLDGAGSTLFGPAWGQLLVEGETPTVAAVGIAASLDLSWGSLAGSGWFGERVYLGAVDRREATAWLVAEAKRIQRTYRCAIVIDGGGPAADLINPLHLAGVDLTVYTTKDVLDACAWLWSAVADGRAAHMGHHELEIAVAGAVKRDVGDRFAWGRRLSSVDVSMLEAATLAAWYVVCNPHSQTVFNMNDLDGCDFCGEELDREIGDDEDDYLCQACYDKNTEETP